MLSCRRSIITRTLGLLGLVLLMVVLVDSGWAADVKESSLADLSQFPFLSSRSMQAAMIANAFAFQMQLFKGFSGGDLSAVRILGMLAVMIGAIMIILFPKYQKMPVMVSWLLLVVITLMAPFGSQLLFTKVNKVNTQMMGYNQQDDGIHDGRSCSENPDGCGFAPQLAAIHVASVLQAIVSDIFRSKAWTGLLERQTAATELYTMLDFDLGTGWINLNKKYASCNEDLETLIPSPKTQSGQQQQDVVDPPMTLMEAWTAMGGSFDDKNGNYMTPPPIIVFPEKPEDIASGATKWQDPENSSGPSFRSRYIAGLKALCVDGSFCSGEMSQKAGPGITMDGANSTISVKQVLDDMKNQGKLFNPWLSYAASIGSKDAGVQVNPGLFMATQSDVGNADNVPAVFRSCFVNNGVISSVWGITLTDRIQECVLQHQGIFNSVSPQQLAITYNYLTSKYLQPTSIPSAADEYGEWPSLINLMANNDAVKNMPVLYGDVEVSEPQGLTKFPTPKITPINRPGCKDTGKKIVLMGINALIENEPAIKGDTGPSKYFSKLVAMLKGDEGAISKAVGPTGTPFTWQDMTDYKAEEISTDPDKFRLVSLMAVRMNEALRRVNKANSVDATTLRVAMINSLLELEQRVTLQKAGIEGSDVLQNAANDGVSMNPKLVGFNRLLPTGWGDKVGAAAAFGIGNLAYEIGRIFAKIGAFFVGPMAIAYMNFLTVLIDFTLMVIITITPLLFLFGLLIPTSAAGVMTIAVMSVFILKFVPITLTIMNGVAGMVYDLLPASVGLDSNFTRDLLVLAMGGLYTNLIGITFFLMFKIGDPAAFLGRLTALDGTAGQLAERGMAPIKLAATAAATAALLATGGAIAGALGAKSLQKRTNDRLRGMSGGVVDAAAEIRENAMKQSSAAETTVKDDQTTPEDARALALRQQLMDVGIDGKKWSAEDVDALLASPDGTFFDKETGATYGFDKNSKDWRAKQLSSGESFNNGRSSEAQRMFELNENRAVQTNADGATKQPKVAEQTGTNADGSSPAVNADGTSKQPALGEDGKPIPGGVGTAAVVSGAADGMPLRVSVVDGKLDSVGGIGAGGAGTGQLTPEQAKAEQVAQQEAINEAKRLADENKKYNDYANNPEFAKNASPENKAKAEAQARELQNTTDEAKRNALKADFAKTMQAEGLTTAMMDRNLNDQLGGVVAGKIGKINEQLRVEGISDATRSELQKRKDALLAVGNDTTGMTQAEINSTLGTIDKMEQASDLRLGADNMPSIARSAYSGMWGALGGAQTGLARIPLIGPAVAESLNEYYEAPERARAWNSVGGRGKMRELQADAQRMGFFQKEVSPIAAGLQYQGLSDQGGFEGLVVGARNTARESVAKTRSLFEGSVEARLATGKADLRTILDNDESFKASLKGLSIAETDKKINAEMEVRFKDFSTQLNQGKVEIGFSNRELKGLGRFEASDRINSVIGEARMMQGASGKAPRSFMVDDRGNYINEQGKILGEGEQKVPALDSNMMLKMKPDGSGPVKYKSEDVNFMLTPQLMNKVRGEISLKKLAGNIDDMLITHYGLVEKQYLRGDAEWDQTRNMVGSAAAAATFARKDVSTDYMIAGHLKMVEGKDGHKNRMGQYEKLVEFRLDENSVKTDFLDRQIAQNGMASVLKAANFDASKFAGMSQKEIQYAQRVALDKYATKNSDQMLKLEAVFNEAQSSGLKKYVERAYVSAFNIAGQDSAIYDKVQKTAVAGINAMDGLNPLANKPQQVNLGSFRQNVASATTMLYDKLFEAAGSKSHGFENINKYMAVVSDVLKKAGRNDNIFVDPYKDANTSRVSYSMSQGTFDNLIKELEKVDPQTAQKFAKSKVTTRDGKVVYSEIEMDSTGKTTVDGNRKP